MTVLAYHIPGSVRKTVFVLTIEKINASDSDNNLIYFLVFSMKVINVQ